MTFLAPHLHHEAQECVARVHIPTEAERLRASQTFNKNTLVAAHLAALRDAYILEMGTHPIAADPHTLISPPSPAASLAPLGPLSLTELKMGKVHRRRMLLGTLCVKSVKLPGREVVSVLEDDQGNAAVLRLANAIPADCGTSVAQRRFPQGSVVAIREPYLTQFPDGTVGLLVENPSDLVFLPAPVEMGLGDGMAGAKWLKMEENEGVVESHTIIHLREELDDHAQGHKIQELATIAVAEEGHTEDERKEEELSSSSSTSPQDTHLLQAAASLRLSTATAHHMTMTLTKPSKKQRRRRKKHAQVVEPQP